MDFYKLRTKRTKEGVIVYPDFVVQDSKDLLVKGRSFYAVWDEERGLWSRDEMDVARIVDADLKREAEKMDATPLLMGSFESKSWTTFNNYVSSLADSDVDLDMTLTYLDDLPDRKNYASRRLPYSLIDGPCPAWDEVVGTLYSPKDREIIEWCIGSIVSGDSKKNQKFLVFYGQPGKGKSTIMNIIEKLFEGYHVPFDAKALTGSNNTFALTAFKHNPLVAIQQDGDLSKIEDNTKLNSLVSHDILNINEKFKSEFYTRAVAFLFLGTNEPVKITGSKSGILRRLLDVHPTGTLIENKRYHVLMSQIDFELGAIAKHCLGVYYKLGKNYYSNYKPTLMMYETDVFFNYIEHNFDLFYVQDGITLDKAWHLYKEFCEDSLIRQKLQRHSFRAELMNYFDKFEERATIDGQQVRSYYSGFKSGRFVKEDTSKPTALVLDEKTSLLDEYLADMPAQYATSSGTPKMKWDDVRTTLSDLDTTREHYTKTPESFIVIDFDLKDENGNKSLERNLEAAIEFPPTYAELSKSGDGIHLHYDYAGDPSLLQPLYSDGIEVKTLLGNASLRRKVSRCNNIPVATISSGLPLKEAPVQDAKAMNSERAVRKLIIENLKKEHHPSTISSVSFIHKILDDAYKEGFAYDVSDLYADVYSFAMDSTNQARKCMALVKEMKFASEDVELALAENDKRIAFFDVEVFPNLIVICWKWAGADTVIRMINPTAKEVDDLLGLRLVGFNCRRYDNHILYALAMGMSIEQVYDISQRIIANDKSAMFGAAYDISYTDIYDFSSVKQSLKKFEIDLGIHHMELGIPWEQPVPEELWDKVAEYCENDVRATEATFEARKADWVAREILTVLSGLTVNSSTNSHSTRIIFGNDRKPQNKFNYEHLSGMFPGYKQEFRDKHLVSVYRGEEVGEGGYVYAEPGVYSNVALLDVASMHPASILNMNLFGDEYTQKFREIVEARVSIKRKDYDTARQMLDGRLKPFLEDESQAKDLSDALKIVINSVYGLTAARFENPFKDPRNKDNIVAKRGALFMVDLKNAVQEQGFTVAHIKTDSIKIPNATPEIIKFVFEFGQKYGYEFEHEATYEEFVLFNDAVYIAKDDEGWHATGAQFQHPYVYKTMLSGEMVEFDDMCETKNVMKGTIHIVNEHGDRKFVGRIGRFVPIKPGGGGGQLMRVVELEDGPKDYAVTGTKGWEWMEAETVRETQNENAIDMTYFENLVTKANKALEEVGYPPWGPMKGLNNA